MKYRLPIVSFIIFFVSLSPAAAQSWKLIVSKTNGQALELTTSDIRDIQFIEEEELPVLEDKNVDQIVIKEVYCGGCQRDEGTEFFQYDKCIVLYNNCPQQIVANNLCIGMANPYNSNAGNKNYDASGRLTYEDEGFIPAQNGIWYYPHSLVIEPYSQVVVNICGAIDNTQTYSQSVNYANKDYYCMYDPESGYNLTNYYPTPADVIPSSHYWKAAKFGQATAWPFSVSSPAVFIYQPQGVSPMEHALNANNLWYPSGVAQTTVYACIKVPAEWIIDGMEVYTATDKEKNEKRLTADIDGGYVYLTNKLGHSLYRNVDQEWTESLAENQGRLIYGYTQGAETTDPSGIDAEASIRNGAHIIYLDTNNSSEDFHERKQCSLRD